MRKISVQGSLDELRTIIEELKKTQAFEVSSFKRDKNDDVESSLIEDYSTLLARINAVLEFSRQSEVDFADVLKKFKKNHPADTTFDAAKQISNKSLYNSIEDLGFDELKALEKRKDEVMAIIERMETASARHFEIKALIEKNKQTIKELEPFLNLDVPFSDLTGTTSTFVKYGTIPTLQLEKFKEDFDLDNFVISEFATGGSELGVVIIGHKHDLEMIEVISNYQFTQFNFDFDRTAKDQTKFLNEKNYTTEKELVQILLSAPLSAEEIVLLKQFYDYIKNEIDTESILNGTIKTRDYYVLNGWVLDSAKKKIIALILAINPRTRIKFGRTVTLDTPPSHIVNTRVIAPYQEVTNMYGAPGKHDLDPNPFVAFFYFLFFGLMIGDIGYGLVMIALTTAVLLWKKPRGGAKNLILIVLMGGVSAVLWGLFFGGFFGFGNEDFRLIPSPVMSPIDDAMNLLMLAMALGVLHVVTGIVLKFANMIRLGRPMDAVCDAGFRLIFFTGVLLAIPGFVFDINLLMQIGIWVAVGGIGLVAITAGRKAKGFGKVSGGFGGVYGFINYFTDILSYARLFGLSLVGAVIAVVANTMGGMFMGSIWTIPIGLLIAVLFHTFNLGLCILSAYIHNARLQFIEFFSKFYDGDGTVFKPAGSNLRFVKIRSNLDTVQVIETELSQMPNIKIASMAH